MTELHPALVPCVQNEDYPKPWWLARHEEKCREAEALGERCRLVFMGDSIIHAWEDLAPNVWLHRYGKYCPLNLGFAGDRTEHLLWRIENGALANVRPAVIVLLIGTNNSGHRRDHYTVTSAAIEAIINAIQSRLPTVKILLLGIFPRGKTVNDPLRKINQQVNLRISQFADQQRVFWLDIGSCFVDELGDLSPMVMSDYLHPNANQYSVWADAMADMLESLLEKS